MSVNLVSDAPKALVAHDGVRNILELYGDILTSCVDDVAKLPYFMYDPTQVPLQFLNMKLQDKGFDLGTFSLTEDQKRNLLGLIAVIYRSKGTLLGITNLIRLLLGLEVTAAIQSADVMDAWQIGVDEMGVGTIIGIEDPASFLVITSANDLTEEQVRNIFMLANYMRVAGTEVLLDYPNMVPPDDEFWMIGVHGFGTRSIGGFYSFIYEQGYPPPGIRRGSFLN